MDMEDLITRLQVLNKTALKYDVEFLELLIEITQSELTELLHYKEYNSAWDLLVLQMCNEKLNKVGNEGLNSVSFSGVSENYTDFYSASIVKQIQSKRRLRMV